ncbi:MAG TPA: PAS domain-containing sensor histidine kinase [Gaiellaceae bacterium]|nr:PAS domain-containing sensor histidine kinase [Gaiellaceae bacterium]
MTRARIALALVALATGIALVFVIAREGTESTLDAALGVAIGWSFVASGLVGWARRPENVIGRVMVLAGFLRLLGDFCAGSDQPVLFPIGHVSHSGFYVAVGYVLLAFPSGRLDGALSRWILVGGGLVLPLRLAWFLLSGEDDQGNVVAAVRSSQGAQALAWIETALDLVILPLLIVVLARRWRHASPRLRFALAPVLWIGTAGAGLFLLSIADDNLGNPLGDIPMLLIDLVLAGVAVGVLVGLLRSRLARSAVAELVVELGQTGAPGDLRNALARALRDPSLALAYWLPDGGRYIDVEGRPFELPAESEARAVSVVEREGRTIAALVHDPALDEEPELVESVCAAAALALENERLQAELRAQLSDSKQQKERLQALIDSSPLALVEYGSDKCVRLWNPAAERIFGWSREEILGHDDLPLAPPSKRAEGEELFARVLAGESLNDYETLRQRKDGTLVDVSIAAAPITDESRPVLGNMVAYTDITERKVQEAEVHRLNAELQARLEELRASRARIVGAADEERRRIERNLHDGTQQRLVSISMALGLAQAKLEKDPAAAGAVVGEARRALSAALRELRELSHGIHPAVLTERGLVAALQELTLHTAVPVELALDGTGRLPEQVEAAAYYVVSEALANIAKYAQATGARVQVQPVDGKVVLEVADDGVGGADAGRGSGLRGLTDRVEALGGRLWFSSPPGQGTIVRAEIPCG